jgi:ABC-type polysaccharide/polyol phosphate transport system ATPase subunit
METVRRYCHRTAYMAQGNLVFFGDTDEAVRLYIRDNGE